MFYEDLEAGFFEYSHRGSHRLEEIHALCHLPPVPELADLYRL